MKEEMETQITSWEIDGETVETVSDFIFLGSKITADGDCSHDIKICLLLGRKVMTNLDSILRSRSITLSTKVCLVKAMVFPVVVYGCESWTFTKISLNSITACKVRVNPGFWCCSPQALWWSTTCSHSASGMWTLGDLGWQSRSPSRSELRVALLFT